MINVLLLRESSLRGIKVFMFENRELCWADRSIRRRFFPSSNSNELKRNWEGGGSKGLIMNPRLIHAAYGGKADYFCETTELRKMATFDVHIQAFTIAVAFLA